MKKRFFTLMVAIMCLFSVVAPASAAGYEEIELDGYNYIDYAATSTIYGLSGSIRITADWISQPASWTLTDGAGYYIDGGVIGGSWGSTQDVARDFIYSPDGGFRLILQCHSSNCFVEASLDVS